MYHVLPKVRLFANHTRDAVSRVNNYRTQQGVKVFGISTSHYQQNREISYMFKDIDETSTKNGG
jgi:hypothetical protein